jgi:tRNA (guanine37-N1)-methyltransferase
MTPQGQTFNQRMAEDLSKETDITFLCGHYEGFDERIRSLATAEISIGDFVLTGGELPALTIIDAVGRLIPGVLGKSISLSHESFNDGLLEGPHYTKPADFRGMMVPDVLLSGNHALIAKFRRQEQLRVTFLNRPDLLERDDLQLDKEDKKFLRKLQEEL